MGFRSWINRVTKCATSILFSVLINSHIGKSFGAHRGLHQGCLLFLFLFLLYAEDLSSLILRAAQTKEIDEIKVAQDLSTISHLFFVDDSLFFVKANEEITLVWKPILHQFELALS